MSKFIVFPAIDLHDGQVIRLQQGDPKRQIIFGKDPASFAHRWLNEGAHWLHVVNLDGAFSKTDSANRLALQGILKVVRGYDAFVQFGGGLRTLDTIENAFDIGVSRVVLATVIMKKPDIFKAALDRFGPDQIAASLDAQDGNVRIEGWQTGTAIRAGDLAMRLKQDGLKWLVFTDISRDGLEVGVNLSATTELAHHTNLNVIASGGVNSADDVQRARRAGLSGIVIGRALYENKIDLKAIIESINLPVDEE